MGIISGPYSGTWNALAIGQTELGYRERYSYEGREISFDSVGETTVDIIKSRMRMTVDFVAQEYDAAAIESLRWPWHATPGQADVLGQSMWELAKPLVLTSCRTGTDPQTKTYIKAILAPGFEIDLNFSHQERPVPLQLLVFPVKYDAGGYTTPEQPTGCDDIVFYTETQWP